MDKCEQELLQYKLREMFCKKHHDDCCDVCIVDCCDDKNKKDSICDCCVKPMAKLLSFLKDNVKAPQLTRILLENGIQIGSYAPSNITILDVNDSILKIKAFSYIYYISICKLSKIETTDKYILKADLEEESLRSCGECDCCERPIREKLRGLIGKNVTILVNGDPYDYSFREIQKVGSGIVITKYKPNPTPPPPGGDLSEEEAEKPEEQNEEQKQPPFVDSYSAYSTCQITGLCQ